MGLEHALDARVLWQVEQSEFCRRVLARHWPLTVRHNDVCTARSLPYVDVMCGGFPCQDISTVGTRTGLDGKRSGLWWEYARLIEEVEPAAVVIENVAALATRGLHRVIGTLAELGYMGRWDVVAAASVGAPHIRRRLFITATHPHRLHLRQQQGWRDEGGATEDVAGIPGSRWTAADTNVSHLDRSGVSSRGSTSSPDADLAGNWWATRPPPSPVRGVDDGLPVGVDRFGRRRRPPADKLRLHALGNAVVPQVAYRIGLQLKQILETTP